MPQESLSPPSSPAPRIQGRRHLELWARPNLARSRRLGEKIGLAAFDARRVGGGVEALQHLASQLRGEDLMVALGKHQILLAAPVQGRSSLEGLLDRVHGILGGQVHSGATLCDPSLEMEGDLPSLRPAVERALKALQEGLAGPPRPRWAVPGGESQ